MELKSQKKDNFWIISISGMMDTLHAKQAEDEIFSLDIQNVNGIILELSGLSYISSSGIRVLIRVHQYLKKKGITMRLCSLQPFIQELLDIADLTQSFLIYDNLEKAKVDSA
jgi:anti-sigma B factor antagonist